VVEPVDPRPAYLRISEWVSDRIRDGTYPVGSKLCSTRELCGQFEVSHMTVGAALAKLCQDGVLVSRHGVGWFVRAVPTRSAPPPPHPAELALFRIHRLHRPPAVPGGMCSECGKQWPCPTVWLTTFPVPGDMDDPTRFQAFKTPG
jgi:DNA-binding transcriptional MocR family regulator